MVKNRLPLAAMLRKPIFSLIPRPRRVRKQDLSTVRTILVMRSGGLGDVVMSTPMLEQLRKLFPRVEITYLTGRASAAVLSEPLVNDVIDFDDQIFIRKKIAPALKLASRIRKRHFDLAFMLDKHWIFGLFARLCRIPIIIGFDRHGEGFLYNLAIPFTGSKYEGQYYCDLARAVAIIKGVELEGHNGINYPPPPLAVEGCKPILYPAKKDIIWADKTASEIRKFRLQRLIGIAPGGASNPGQEFALKRWPEERYLQLVKMLLDKGYAVAIFGSGRADLRVSRSIIGRLERNRSLVHDFTGRLSILQSTALMKHCDLFITHDSGPTHLAATQTKTIALFGPTPSRRFAPENAIVIEKSLKCQPCYTLFGGFKKGCKRPACMRGISVEEVFDVAEGVLG
ncbi:hypothetical protein COT48_00895 [Candidatus Woesearchaeota archaeon CG08_land_8_20_14_0_20_47_9]|nr:MAG: hypothetical protein AUJ69_04385 [Candidatus Woesearchaeota archaeon CG1_02_47_18]PIO04346.1 MAG: hypothetical protein COT48_00895 [Candidatus Woesearchaeota archaeon CG08_land_8_20_14_0_20_47_9]HII29454.1 glycosyltransferase family 9 protein [Candidatus Woesearchaeota archaeon]